MAFKQAYSNTKNILADFVTSLCYEKSDNNLQENWQLIYPKQQDLIDFLDFLSNKSDIDNEDKKFLSYTTSDIKDDIDKRRDLVFRWIVEHRRSTVSCMYLPELQWERSERVGITKEILTQDTNERLFVKLKKPLDKEASIGVYLQDKKIWFYQNNDLDTLSTVEFYPDYENNGLIINKSNISFKGTDVVYLNINYQTYSEDPMTWYVDFNYPPVLNGKRKNYHYFEWTFGKEIDSNYHIVNKKKKPVVIRGCWHTSAELDKNIDSQDLSWLPIEYFMSWDLNSVSFVLCEDPIVEVNRVIHSYNYIGVLEGIKDADYDDIEGNFGSCGSYDIRVQSSQGNPVSKNISLERANITFVRKMYDSYFNLASQGEVLLQLRDVYAGNYTIDKEVIEDLPDFDSSSLQISDGLTSVTKTLQVTAIDNATSCSLTYDPLTMVGTVKTTSPTNTPMKRYNIFRRSGKKGIISMDLGNDFEVNIGTTAVPIYQSTKLLSNDNKFSMDSGQLVVLDTNNEIFLSRETNVIDSRGLSSSLAAGIKVTLQTQISIPYTVNQSFQLPSGTIVIDILSKESYRLVANSFIMVNKLLLQSASPITLTVEKETEFDISNPIPVGSKVKLMNAYIEVDYSFIADYIVEFQYKTPFIGDIRYYFPSVWFDGLNVSRGSRTGTLTNTTITTHDYGSLLDSTGVWQTATTGLITPIVAEPMKKDENDNIISIYNKVIEIDDVDTDIERDINTNDPILRGKNDVMPAIINTSYHKVKANAPEIITNEHTNESWKLQGSAVKRLPNSVIDRTTDSMTNIVMYPRQVYTSDFIYRKRTGNKAVITLGEIDRTRLGVYLVNSENEILASYDGSQVYKNITIARNADRGVSLAMDINNLNNEKIYLGIYRYSLYFKSQSWISSNTGYRIDFENIKVDTFFEYKKLFSEHISSLYNTNNIAYTDIITTTEVRENSFYSNIPYSATNVQKPIVGSSVNVLKILEIDLNNKDFIFKPLVFSNNGTVKHVWQ